MSKSDGYDEELKRLRAMTGEELDDELAKLSINFNNANRKHKKIISAAMEKIK